MTALGETLDTSTTVIIAMFTFLQAGSSVPLQRQQRLGPSLPHPVQRQQHEARFLPGDDEDRDRPRARQKY